MAHVAGQLVESGVRHVVREQGIERRPADELVAAESSQREIMRMTTKKKKKKKKRTTEHGGKGMDTFAWRW